MHVVATAGHVDHGKSMLVRALTGMEPDRWEAERRRGMTIDLGYAWMTLPSGDELAFVDVPGHERFITNMLAGVGPVPAVLFVVAADEAWMPQSAEHLAALDALGVRHGVLAVTRADLADPGPALRQAARTIAGTSLGEVEAVAVSALTGQGLPELTAALGRLTARLPRPDPRGHVRLWLDRVFAIKGSGTVVTGTLQAGTVQAGDELTVAPAMRTVRIRGVQSLGAPAAHVGGVARVALNLRGVSTRELGRGMALIQPGRWTVTSIIDVRLAPVPAEQEQQAGTVRLPPRLSMHIGAARAVARARMLGTRFARLTLDHPLPLHVGDRVLLRDPGAATDHGGGRPVFGATVLDVSPPRLRGNGAAVAAERELASWPEIPAAPDLLRRHRLLRAGRPRPWASKTCRRRWPGNGWPIRDTGDSCGTCWPWRLPRTRRATRWHPASRSMRPGPNWAWRTESWSKPWQRGRAAAVPVGGSRQSAGICAAPTVANRTSRKTLVVPSGRGSGRTGRMAGQHRSGARPGSAMTWCQGSARPAAAMRNPPGRAFRRR